MVKEDFIAKKDVTNFIEWLASDLSTIQTSLNIKSTKFVPGGLHVACTGVDSLLVNYRWKSTGMLRGDWIETKSRLAILGSQLQAAVKANNNAATLIACRDILVWGGNRNFSVGAYPFLNDLHSKGIICDYIRNAGLYFSLANADEANLSPPVTLMNAMLTKVHALYATDGLPIYDSRVAAAIATLVERWRVSAGFSAAPLPPELSFPATVRSRTVQSRYPLAINPIVMVYGSTTPALWSSAKVRLGWIIEEVLKHSEIFSSCCTSQTKRMHAFEASLFMMGYDVCCII
jgi:hypothetical protein